MKKILLCLACVALAGSVALAATTTVAPRALRSYADQFNDGAIWQIGSGALIGFPDCGTKTTVIGAAYVGNFDTFEIVAPRTDTAVEDDYAHDMMAFIVMSADDLPAPGPGVEYYIDLGNMSSYGFGYQLSVAVADYERIQLQFEGRGPFGGATANFSRASNLLLGASNHPSSVLAVSKVVPFAPLVTSQSIHLNPGAGSIRACVGPTGQVRFLLPENNGTWDESCNNWDEREIQLSSGALEAELVAAQSRAPLTTCNVSCSPIGAGDRNRDCTNVITHPFALVIHAGNGAQNRAQQWLTLESPITGFGVDNILVLGGDPTEPSTIAIRAETP